MTFRSTLVCTGSDGSGFVYDNARICSQCGVAFENVSRTPIHFVRLAEDLKWPESWDA